MKKLIFAGTVLLAFMVAGCSMYTGLSQNDGKLYISSTDGSTSEITICDIGTDGALENCVSTHPSP